MTMSHCGFIKFQLTSRQDSALESFKYANNPNFLFAASHVVHRNPPMADVPIHFYWLFFNVEDVSGYGRSGLELLLNQVFYQKCIKFRQSTGKAIKIRDVVIFDHDDLERLVSDWLDCVAARPSPRTAVSESSAVK